MAVVEVVEKGMLSLGPCQQLFHKEHQGEQDCKTASDKVTYAQAHVSSADNAGGGDDEALGSAKDGDGVVHANLHLVAPAVQHVVLLLVLAVELHETRKRRRLHPVHQVLVAGNLHEVLVGVAVGITLEPVDWRNNVRQVVRAGPIRASVGFPRNVSVRELVVLTRVLGAGQVGIGVVEQRVCNQPCRVDDLAVPVPHWITFFRNVPPWHRLPTQLVPVVRVHVLTVVLIEVRQLVVHEKVAFDIRRHLKLDSACLRVCLVLPLRLGALGRSEMIAVVLFRYFAKL